MRTAICYLTASSAGCVIWRNERVHAVVAGRVEDHEAYPPRRMSWIGGTSFARQVTLPRFFEPVQR